MMTQLVADVGHNLPVPQAEGPAAIFRERRGFLLYCRVFSRVSLGQSEELAY